MTIEESIRLMVAINFMVIGLSHVFQPAVWVDFFRRYREAGEVGVFYTALLHLPMGSVIVAFHQVWSGIPAILSVIGCAYIVKSLLYFTYPKWGLRMLQRTSRERAWEFQIPGVLLTVIGGLLIYSIR